MNTMKAIILIASGLLVAVAVGIGWNAARAANEANTTLANTRRNVASMSEKERRSEARIAAAENDQMRLRERLEKLVQSKSGSVAAEGNAQTASSPAVATRSAALSREESKAALDEVEYLAQERVRFANVYRPFFAKQRLSREQIEQFIAIGLKRFERVRDLNSQTIMLRDDPVLENLRQQAEVEEDAAYRILLGEAAYQRLHDYERTIMARDHIGGFAADAVLAGVSLTAAQLEAMVEIVGGNSHTFQGGHYKSWNAAAADWAMLDLQLRPLMSEAQWAFYQRTAQTKGSYRLNYKFEAAIRQAAETDVAKKAPQSSTAPSR